MCIIKNEIVPTNVTVEDNIWLIIFVSIVMFIGVCIGGRKIVENIGNNTVKLDNVKGIVSDIATIINLFIASFFGIPVSTTHVKTMSIIGLGEQTTNKKSVLKIFETWIWTFPVCFILAYVIAKFMLSII
jgi:PiT family inorganic phosphate transporter